MRICGARSGVLLLLLLLLLVVVVGVVAVQRVHLLLLVNQHGVGSQRRRANPPLFCSLKLVGRGWRWCASRTKWGHNRGVSMCGINVKTRFRAILRNGRSCDTFTVTTFS